MNRVETEGRTERLDHLGLAGLARNITFGLPVIEDQPLSRLGAVGALRSREASPRIRRMLAKAWHCLERLQLEAFLIQMKAIETELKPFHTSLYDSTRQDFQMLQVIRLMLQNEDQAALSLAQVIRREADGSALAAVATMICRLVNWRLGDVNGYYNLPRQDLPRRRADAVTFPCVAKSIDAIVAFQQLRFGVAERFAHDALAIVEAAGDRKGPGSVLPTVVVAQIDYERGFIDQAEAALRNVLPFVRTLGSQEIAERCYPLMAKIAAERGQKDFATGLLAEAERLGRERGWHRLIAIALYERIDLFADEGHIGEAEALMDRLRALQSAGAHPIHVKRILSGYHLLALSRLEFRETLRHEIIDGLRTWQCQAAADGDYYLGVQISLKHTLALQAAGLQGEAVECLMRTLELGADRGLFQSIVMGGADLGEPLKNTLHTLRQISADRQHLVPYAQSILDGWTRVNAQKAMIKVSRSKGLLSGRECAILDLIRGGLSNKRIAQRLTIAPETVKSHLKHTFVKLGVQSRVQAVSRAENLGFI